MLTLPDIYCLFNRARGTELISPDDLLQAVSQFESLGLPMRMRRFDSGVIVVQSDRHDEAEVRTRLSAFVAEHDATGVSSIDVASHMGISLPIANEHLLAAEVALTLCRDDTVEGVRFFPNRFIELW